MQRKIHMYTKHVHFSTVFYENANPMHILVILDTLANYA